MIAYVQMCLRALVVLWQLKKITRVHCLKLWLKSLNLYFCFLAFADKERPKNQCWNAMVAALLSAVYDHDTDWSVALDYESSNFRLLLESYVRDEDAVKIGRSLFERDLEGKLSEDGLERGSAALTFYTAIIGSVWMDCYTPQEINAFGRLLQIIDDLIDFDNDKKKGHKNCFLCSSHDSFLVEAQVFLESDFYHQLEDHSRVYRMLELKCQETINTFDGNIPSKQQLFKTTRPHCGIYSSALTFASMGFSLSSLALTALTAASFFGITSSVIVFNDLIDRHHDVKKKKTFARDHAWLLSMFWCKLSALTLIPLLALGAVNVWMGILCLAVWCAGLVYSFIPHWYVAQNLLVALCSASPVLAAVVDRGEISYHLISIFFAIFMTVFISEVVKDIEDQRHDAGYKNTIPVKHGHLQTAAFLILLCCLPVFFLVSNPAWPVKATSFLFAPIVFQNGLMMFRPEKFKNTLMMIDLLLLILVIVLISAHFMGN